jgi:LPXTG-motif cell wall-anchored protein
MAAEYLFACVQCERTFKIDESQAGGRANCPHCMSINDLPKLSSIRALSPAQETKAGTANSSQSLGVAQTWLFVIGLPLLIGSLIVGGVFWSQAKSREKKIRDFDPTLAISQTEDSIDGLDVEKLWELWHDEIVENPPGEWKQSELAVYKQGASAKSLLANIAFGFAGIGLLLVLAAFFTRKKRQPAA